MWSEEKERNQSVLMPSQDLTLLLYPMIRGRRDLVSPSVKNVYKFLTRVNMK